jgi:membrane-associated phospholipid phosphatase
MILASRLLPVRANRLANIIAGSIVTLVNGFLTFIPPLIGLGRPPALPEYLFFATIETVCTVAIVWQAWTWPGMDAAVAPTVIVGQRAAGISSSQLRTPS